jgi:DNA-binding NtrC family response regulator
MADRLLIIEDDSDACMGLARHYRKKGWQVEVAGGTAEARAQLLDNSFDPLVIIADLGLPDGSILDHLEDLQDSVDCSEWIFVFEDAEHDDIERIDELAYDFLVKPLEQRRLDIIVKRAQRSALTRRRLQNYSMSEHKRYPIDAYLGQSEPVEALKEMLGRLTEVPLSTLIITGETGTGKGLAARIIHHCGLRRDRPMVELNCAALPRDLLESELYGHEAGAFTGAKGRHRGLFEQADGGTLFLDEIGDMDLELQSKLLKAIEDRKIRRLGSERELDIDVQIIAATHRDLEAMAREGNFREDLYHRLSVFCVTLPTLRERPSDLVELVPRLVAEYNTKANRRIEIIPDSVWEQLLQHDWPGNVRELRNVIERCVLLSKDEVLPEQWLQLTDSCSPAPQQECDDANAIKVPLDGSMSLDEMDKHIIHTALEHNDYNVTETARILGTTRETLRYRIQKYGLQTSEA